MRLNASSPLLQRRMTQWLVLSFMLLLSLALYGNWLIRITPEPYTVLWRLGGPFLLFTDFLNPLYASLWSYFGCLILGLALSFAMLIGGRPSLGLTSLFCAAVVGFAAAPFLLPTMYGAYQIEPTAAAGYHLQWVTEPEDVFLSAFKSAQRRHESYGCVYTLLGWSHDNRLFYRSGCAHGIVQYDAVDQSSGPKQSGQPTDLATQAEAIFGTAASTHVAGLGGNQDYFVAYERAISPDKRFTAYLIKTYYGPSDVVILSQVDP